MNGSLVYSSVKTCVYLICKADFCLDGSPYMYNAAITKISSVTLKSDVNQCVLFSFFPFFISHCNACAEKKAHH